MKITILDASPKKLTKQFNLIDNEIKKSDYDRCYEYEYNFAECGNIQDLYELLAWLATQPTMCIIRAKLKTNITPNTKVVRQKSSVGAPFMENPDGVDFIMCDFDKIDIPEWLPNDLDYYLEYLISTLPEYMHEVSYVYQWSSQAGMDNWKTLRCHIWFWLEEARTDKQMENWANSLTHDDIKVIDPSVMRTVQPNYTANPIFGEGVLDPLPGTRVGLINKKQKAALIPLVQGATRNGLLSSGVYVPSLPPPGLDTKFDVRLKAIGPDYHMPITQAVASWISLTGNGSDYERLKQRLRDRISSAPGEGSAGRAHYMSDEYLNAEIKGCPFSHKLYGPTRLPETAVERVRYKLTNGKDIFGVKKGEENDE